MSSVMKEDPTSPSLLEAVQLVSPEKIDTEYPKNPHFAALTLPPPPAILKSSHQNPKKRKLEAISTTDEDNHKAFLSYDFKAELLKKCGDDPAKRSRLTSNPIFASDPNPITGLADSLRRCQEAIMDLPRFVVDVANTMDNGAAQELFSNGSLDVALGGGRIMKRLEALERVKADLKEDLKKELTEVMKRGIKRVMHQHREFMNGLQARVVLLEQAVQDHDQQLFGDFPEPADS